MSIIRGVHASSIATQWLRILFDYAYLSDESDPSRGISQIVPRISTAPRKSFDVRVKISNITSSKSHGIIRKEGDDAKKLGYKTPYEVFFPYICSRVALDTGMCAFDLHFEELSHLLPERVKKQSQSPSPFLGIV